MADHPTKRAPASGSTAAEKKQEIDQIRESDWAKTQSHKGRPQRGKK
jgi:hypothetical protein